MLYFSNGGPTIINPSKYYRKKDRGDFKDRIADHFMEGYKECLDIFLKEQKDGKVGVDI